MYNDGTTGNRRMLVAAYMRQKATLSSRDNIYKSAWRNSAQKIEDAEHYLGIRLYTDSFDQHITESYHYYLRARPEKYKVATVNSFMRRLFEALRDAATDGFLVHWGFEKFILKNEEAFAVALDEEEIYKVFQVPLGRKAHAVRERIVIGCWLGLRFIDLRSIQALDFAGDNYERRVTKGKRRVVIPVHWMIRAVIARNNGIIPEIPTRQAFSGTMKRICKKAGIEKKILYEQTEGLHYVRKWVPKYQLISPHTLRRSLATNMYLAGIIAKRIMLITGHKTEESFFRYIRILPEENASELGRHSFFTGEAVQDENKPLVKNICSCCLKGKERGALQEAV